MNDTTTFFDSNAAQMRAAGMGLSGGVAAAVLPAAAGIAAAAGEAGALLESFSNTVGSNDEDGIAQSSALLHICGNRCKDWFCSHCAKIQGYRLRQALIQRIQWWKHPMMLTCTLDHQIFPEGPDFAFKLVLKKRAIAEMMKFLEKYHGGYWFCVLEWQCNGWPHWHILIDSEFIPIKEVEKAWGRFVPRDRRHLVRSSIGTMGMCRYSSPPGGFKNGCHAARYVTKYLIKPPEHAYPEWVLDAPYRIRRYSTSRGFWGELTHRDASTVGSGEQKLERVSHTHRERLAKCCTTCSVFAVTDTVDVAEVEVNRQRHFLGKLNCNARALAGIMREVVDDARKVARMVFHHVAGCGLYVRDAFVSYPGTWRDFLDEFREEIEASPVCQTVNMGLRLEK